MAWLKRHANIAVIAVVLVIAISMIAAGWYADHSAPTPMPLLHCADFATWEEAQRHFNADPAAVPYMDADEDGFACEWRPGANLAWQTDLIHTPTPAPTPVPTERPALAASRLDENNGKDPFKIITKGILIVILILIGLILTPIILSRLSDWWNDLLPQPTPKPPLPHGRPVSTYIPPKTRKEQLAELSYKEYLKTPDWKAIRSRTIDLQGRVCHDCGTRRPSDRFEVHHLHYRDPRGFENNETLLVLCDACHERRHPELLGK